MNRFSFTISAVNGTTSEPCVIFSLASSSENRSTFSRISGISGTSTSELSTSRSAIALSFQKRYFVANQCRACSRSFASRPKLFRRICRIWLREHASTMRTRDARGASAQLRRRRDRASRGCKRFASAGFRAGSASFSTSWQTVCKHRFSHQAFCVGIGKERLGVAKRRGQNPWS